MPSVPLSPIIAVSAQHELSLCIRQIDWSETSQIVWLFARGLGVVRTLAKGSKRAKGPYSGGVDLLTLAEAGIIIRPGSELALLTRWDLREAFPALRRSLAAYHAGVYAADLIAHLVRDHDPHPRLFDETVACLRALRDSAAVGPSMLRLQWSALAEAGFQPELATNVRSGEPLAEAESYLFTPTLGGLLPDEGGVYGDASGAWRVRAATVDMLRTVKRGEVLSLSGGLDGGESVGRANRLLASYIRHLLGSEPPTMRAAFGGRGLRR